MPYPYSYEDYQTSGSWPSWNNIGSTQTDVWPIWSTQLGSTGSNQVVWNTWNSITITATGTNSVWSDWNLQFTPYVVPNSINTQPLPTATYAEQMRTTREHQAEAERTRQESIDRAKALLRLHLTAHQRRQLSKKGYFCLYSGSRKRYRINHGHAGNVAQIDRMGRVLRTFCIHPSAYQPDGQLPVEDTMLAQKLWLESNEEDFWRVANITERVATDRAHA